MGDIWVHKKRGSVYEVLSDRARVLGWQSYDDGDPILVYRVPGVGWRAGTRAECRASTQIAHVQCSKTLHVDDPVVIYRGVNDHKIWVRPRREFFDGRFYVPGLK